MKSRKVAVPIEVEEEPKGSLEAVDKGEPVSQAASAESQTAAPESAEVRKAEPELAPEPEITKPKQKRAMTEAKREALRKANEARALKRKERMEAKSQEQQQKKPAQDDELEKKILQILEKQKPALPAKPPKGAIRRTPAVKRRAVPRVRPEPVEVYEDSDESEMYESEEESSEEEYEQRPVARHVMREAPRRMNPMQERHSKMYAMIFRH